MKKFIKNYIFTPFIEASLVGLSIILILMYIILPGLTQPNTVLNIIAFMILCFTGMFVVKYIQGKLTKKVN